MKVIHHWNLGGKNLVRFRESNANTSLLSDLFLGITPSGRVEGYEIISYPPEGDFFRTQSLG